jgi:uncharacterized protein YcbK (DUF882 family)
MTRPLIGMTLLCSLGLGLGLEMAAPSDAQAATRNTAQVHRPPRASGRVPVGFPALLARGRPARDPAAVRLPGIAMEHITSHATFTLRPDLRGGGFSSRQMQALAAFLRCHHTGRKRPMDPRLISLLYATARHYNNAKIHVISGYRAPKVAKAKGNTKSPHKRGVACDFRLEGVSLPALRDYLRRAYHNVGVGYYPNSGFVHLDVGRTQSAFWIDYSGPGEPARYSADPQADLRDGTAERGGPMPPAPLLEDEAATAETPDAEDAPARAAHGT